MRNFIASQLVQLAGWIAPNSCIIYSSGTIRITPFAIGDDSRHAVVQNVHPVLQ